MMNAEVWVGFGAALQSQQRSVPVPAATQILIHIDACGVCRTDLHLLDGELPTRRCPVIPGHEIVGTIASCGREAQRWPVGTRVGVPWLAGSCGRCEFCLRGQENLCDLASFTGYDVDGGYAEFTVADPTYCVAIPPQYGDAEAAPLLCAGVIGYRALRMAGEPRRLGLYGFGAAAHILCQVAVQQGREVYAFTRPGDRSAQALAIACGAVWAGDSTDASPLPLDAAILFAPVGALVPQALRFVGKGGSVVCAGIHMSDIPSMRYERLWGERCLRSVANLTRADAEDFMTVAAGMKIRTSIERLPLSQANEALAALREGRVHGAAVLIPGMA